MLAPVMVSVDMDLTIPLSGLLVPWVAGQLAAEEDQALLHLPKPDVKVNFVQ